MNAFVLVFFSFPSSLLRGELKRGQLDGSITTKSKHGRFRLSWEWEAWREGMTAWWEGMMAWREGKLAWREVMTAWRTAIGGRG